MGGSNSSLEVAEEVIKNRSDINIPDDTVQKLLNILPFSSHNQRSTGSIIVQIKDLNNHKIDVLDIIEIIEDSKASAGKAMVSNLPSHMSDFSIFGSTDIKRVNIEQISMNINNKLFLNLIIIPFFGMVQNCVIIK